MKPIFQVLKPIARLASKQSTFRLFTTKLILLLAAAVGLAADIPVENRVKNREPGYCGWCCLEMLGRTQKIKKLYDIAKDRDKDPDFVYFVQNGPYLHRIVEPKNLISRISGPSKLESLGVKYKMTLLDRKHLAEAAKTTGGVVFMKPGAYGRGAHAVIITKYGEETITLLDPNTTKEDVVNRKWFDKFWDGTTLTVE